MQFLFVGDVMLGRLVNQVLKSESAYYPWVNVLPLFKIADVRICNLECVMSDVGQPWSMTSKVFHFRTDEKNISVLKTAHIDAVSIANNHVLDYEYEAMFRMIEILSANHVKFAGSGINYRQASRPAMWVTQGKIIGLIAFTNNEPYWQAQNNRPGIFYVPLRLNDKRAVYLFNLVKKTKALVDFLIVSAHWEPNWGYHPQPEHIPFAKALIESGADVIFGHSCHVFQGIEIYQGKPILYSTGDFIDDYKVDEVERNDQSFVFMITTTNSNITSVQLYPTIIRAMQAKNADGAESRKIVERMLSLCSEFDTTAVWNTQAQCLQIEVGSPH